MHAVNAGLADVADQSAPRPGQMTNTPKAIPV
jgi:hypothetical protein